VHHDTPGPLQTAAQMTFQSNYDQLQRVTKSKEHNVRYKLIGTLCLSLVALSVTNSVMASAASCDRITHTSFTASRTQIGFPGLAKETNPLVGKRYTEITDADLKDLEQRLFECANSNPRAIIGPGNTPQTTVQEVLSLTNRHLSNLKRFRDNQKQLAASAASSDELRWTLWEIQKFASDDSDRITASDELIKLKATIEKLIQAIQKTGGAPIVLNHLRRGLEMVKPVIEDIELEIDGDQADYNREANTDTPTTTENGAPNPSTSSQSKPTKNPSELTTQLITLYTIADFCADRNIVFNSSQIEKFGALIKTRLDQEQIPSGTRQALFNQMQTRLEMFGLKEASRYVIEQQCNTVRTSLMFNLPEIFVSGNYKKSPF